MNDSRKTLLPALVAFGGSLAANHASALELGELDVQSTLGEPLRASIAYALGPNETLADYCVTLKQGFSASGLPAITRGDLRVANGVISLTGSTPLREPLMTLRINVSCPYTANLTRDYMLLIDPAQPSQPAMAAEAAVPAAPVRAEQPTARAATPPRSTTPRPVQRTTEATAIDAARRYRVQPGDSLSEIASRIENRPVGLWAAVAEIFEANPDAFIDNDPNMLKAGSWLTIPAFDGVADSAFAASAAPVDPAPRRAVTQPDVAGAAGAADAWEPLAAEQAATGFADDTDVLEPAAAPLAADLRPGDIILDDGSALTAEPAPSVAIPDTAIEAPPLADTPNRTVAVPVPDTAAFTTGAPAATNSIGWWLWLIGGGVALLAGLLIFGRRGRVSVEPEPFADAPLHPLRRSSDTGTVEAIPELRYELEDDSPTDENLALDADLSMGTGLSEREHMHVSEDFGFAASTHLDLELPEEAEAKDEPPETDIIAPPTAAQSSILESEVLPEDDDYDMSVIVDATKMPRSDEVTERDLKAVVVADDDLPDTDNYTVSKEIDYDILEQDYEEELSATQALNLEIERAAAELAKRMDADEDDRNDETAEMKLATVTALDITSKLPANQDDADDGFDKTEELVADDETAEMPAGSEEDTAKMPAKSHKA